MKRARAKLASNEAGWTLIELLVAMSIFTFVLGAALSLFETSVKSAPREQERAAAIREAQTGLSAMTQEAHNAYDIVALTPNVLDVLVTRQGVKQHVRYECGVTDNDVTPALNKCVRSRGDVPSNADDPLPALGTPKTVIGRMLNGTSADPVFSYTTPPQNPLDPEDDPADYPDAVVCDPPATGYCLPGPWPTSIDVKIKVPSKGRLAKGGYTYSVSYTDALYLRNLDAKQSAYNSGS
jgi:prepilin-type N-terminal cleavage/methylation domain-containing protein